MKNKLLLINLPCYSMMKDFVENQYNYNPSLGLIAITEYVSMFGFDSIVMDYNYKEINYDEIGKMLEEEKITVVGITSYTENLNIMFKFIRALKALKNNLIIFVGGPHATLKPEDIIKNHNVDYVTGKDGESTVFELLLHLEYGNELIHIEDVEGIVYKIGKEKKFNKNRENINDLDLLPVINRERMKISKYNNVVTMYTSKGCPGKCIYCSASFISGTRYRMRNITNVFLECQVVYNQVIGTTNKIFFIDDTFTVSTKRVKEFCNLSNNYGLKMEWSCESRVDVMTEEIIDCMAGSNCYSIQFGVESGNQDVLDSLKKHINLKHLENMVAYANNYNIGIFTSFIVGHYKDTKESMNDTINFIKKLKTLNKGLEYSVSINTPFPGTWQYEHAKSIGMEIFDQDYSHYNLATPVFRTDKVDEKMLLEFYQKANSFATYAPNSEI